MQYDVTIAIPVYNAEKYLRDTMMSALAQDYPSIEFLILDDCGTDTSIDIIRQIQQEHQRGKDMRIVSQPRNMGVGAARNRIIDEARGEFLYFLDADDLIIPTTISLMMDAARRYDAQWVRASHERVEAYNGKLSRESIVYEERSFTDNDSYATFAIRNYGHLDTTIWNILFKVSLLRQHRLRFVETNFWEDIAFTYELVTYVERAVLLPTITYSYYCRENTLSNFQNRSDISKSEILRNVATVDSVKPSCLRLLEKSYFSEWLNAVLTTDFHIACNAIKKRQMIRPYITDAELRSIMQTPLSLNQTIRYGGIRQVVFWLMGALPPSMSVLFLKIAGKAKGVL